MKRSWNPRPWAGFALCVAAFVSYPTFFARYSITRDFPWLTLLLMALGLFLVASGVLRAIRQPDAYRGKIFGSVLGVLSVALVGLFLFGIFHLTRQLPASHGAPQVGQLAPDFTLPDSQGNNVTLSNLLNSPFATDAQPGGSSPPAKTARGHPDLLSRLLVTLLQLRAYGASKRACQTSTLAGFESSPLAWTRRRSPTSPPVRWLHLPDSLRLRRRRYPPPWNLVHSHAGVDGADISRPAEFLIDSNGKVRWENFTEDLRVRARPEQVLQAFDTFTASRR